MNVIGAILAVLGYSINDTIVIFARIRDNVKRMPNRSMYDIINISITETLSRTLLTTFATTLVVIALFLFGGETFKRYVISALNWYCIWYLFDYFHCNACSLCPV